jgi:hypothetical protein
MGILRVNKVSGLEAPTPVTGSVVFDGSGDSLTLPASNDFAFGIGDFTVECWLYLTSSTTYYAILHGTTNTTDTFGFVLNSPSGLNYISYAFTVGGTPVSYTNLPTLPNTWQHHALVRKNGILEWFINGISQGTSTFSNNVTATGSLKIGAISDNSAALNGYISNLRILKGTALYTSNFTPPTRELQPIGDTVLLCCNNSTSATAEATGKTITANGNAAASTFSPGLVRDFTYGIQFDGVTKFDTQGYFVPPSGNTQNRYTLGLDEIVTSGLVLHLDAGNPFSYPATGVGTKWTDLSGNNNHGTLNGGVSYTGNNRGSLVFDGVNDYVNCTSGFIANNSNFSVDIWFKRGAQADKYLYSEGSTASISPFWGITSHIVGGTLTNLRIYARNNSGTEELNIPLTGTQYSIYNDTNRNLVVSYSSNTIYFYIDGVYIGSNSWTKGSYSNLNQINIGRFAALADVGGYMNGNIYAIKTYNKALSATEVQQNYEALKGRYGYS